MQFNSADKSISIIADIDFLLWGDSTTFNTAYSLIDRTRNVNLTLDEVVAELFKADPNFMWDDITNPDFPIATMDLDSSTDHWTLPDASLRIHRVRVKDSSGNFKTLTSALRSELSDDELATTGVPEKYYKLDNAIFPVPAPNYSATGGVELQFQRSANHFSSTDTDKTPGFASIFHQFLSIGAALRYAMSNGMAQKVSFLTGERERIRKMIVTHYENRSPDERPKLRLVKPDITKYGF